MRPLVDRQAELGGEERPGQRLHEGLLFVGRGPAVASLNILVIQGRMPQGLELCHHLAGVTGVDTVVSS